MGRLGEVRVRIGSVCQPRSKAEGGNNSEREKAGRTATGM